jgi:hypothetical protein
VYGRERSDFGATANEDSDALDSNLTRSVSKDSAVHATTCFIREQEFVRILGPRRILESVLSVALRFIGSFSRCPYRITRYCGGLELLGEENRSREGFQVQILVRAFNSIPTNRTIWTWSRTAVRTTRFESWCGRIITGFEHALTTFGGRASLKPDNPDTGARSTCHRTKISKLR